MNIIIASSRFYNEPNEETLAELKEAIERAKFNRCFNKQVADLVIKEAEKYMKEYQSNE